MKLDSMVLKLNPRMKNLKDLCSTLLKALKFLEVFQEGGMPGCIPKSKISIVFKQLYPGIDTASLPHGLIGNCTHGECFFAYSYFYFLLVDSFSFDPIYSRGLSISDVVYAGFCSLRVVDDTYWRKNSGCVIQKIKIIDNGVIASHFKQ